MSGQIERGICNFCHQDKNIVRTYLRPSKYVKQSTLEERNKLYNQGEYFYIIRTCTDCGVPKTDLQKPVESDAIEFAEWVSTTDWSYEDTNRWYKLKSLKYKPMSATDYDWTTTQELYEQFKQLKK